MEQEGKRIVGTRDSTGHVHLGQAGHAKGSPSGHHLDSLVMSEAEQVPSFSKQGIAREMEDMQKDEKLGEKQSNAETVSESAYRMGQCSPGQWI